MYLLEELACCCCRGSISLGGKDDEDDDDDDGGGGGGGNIDVGNKRPSDSADITASEMHVSTTSDGFTPEQDLVSSEVAVVVVGVGQGTAVRASSIFTVFVSPLAVC